MPLQAACAEQRAAEHQETGWEEGFSWPPAGVVGSGGAMSQKKSLSPLALGAVPASKAKRPSSGGAPYDDTAAELSHSLPRPDGIPSKQHGRIATAEEYISSRCSGLAGAILPVSTPRIHVPTSISHPPFGSVIVFGLSCSARCCVPEPREAQPAIRFRTLNRFPERCPPPAAP